MRQGVVFYFRLFISSRYPAVYRRLIMNSTLTLTTLGVLVLVSQLFVHVLLRLARAAAQVRHGHAARRQPQEVVRLELVDLVEKGVESVQVRRVRPWSVTQTYELSFSSTSKMRV